MGNNLCYQTGERSSQFPQLLLKEELGTCEIALTAGPVENEDVECLVIPTDPEYSNIKEQDKPSFKQVNGQCVFVQGKKKHKHQILAVIQEDNAQNCDKSDDDEKQNIYQAVQEALKMAESKQIKSVGFPVFESKDYTTAATIMLMAIKHFFIEQQIKYLKRIAITLDHIEQQTASSGYSSKFLRGTKNLVIRDIQVQSEHKWNQSQSTSQTKSPKAHQKLKPPEKM